MRFILEHISKWNIGSGVGVSAWERGIFPIENTMHGGKQKGYIKLCYQLWNRQNLIERSTRTVFKLAVNLNLPDFQTLSKFVENWNNSKKFRGARRRLTCNDKQFILLRFSESLYILSAMDIPRSDKFSLLFHSPRHRDQRNIQVPRRSPFLEGRARNFYFLQIFGMSEKNVYFCLRFSHSRTR